MSLSVNENTGNRPTYRFVQEIDEHIEQFTRDGFFHFMKALKKRASKSVLKRKSGRRYRVRSSTGSRRTHFASRPFESHANRSGTLRRSISWKVRGSDNATFGYGVSTSVRNSAPEWAPMVEFGTIGFKAVGPMAARPTLNIAVDEENMQPHFDLAFDREF
jgi:hypothetical protein